MASKRLFASHSIFYCVGITLIVLAFILLPMHIDVKIEGSMMGETERMGFGWLFAPVLAAWGFASIVISATENYGPSIKTAFRCLPALLIIYALLFYAGWMAIRFGVEPFWWVHFSVIVTPSVIATVAAALHMTGKGKLTSALTSMKVRLTVLVTALATPIVFTASTWYLFTVLSS